MPSLALVVGGSSSAPGRRIRGWQSATIRRSIDELAPAFSVEVRTAAGLDTREALAVGEYVEVLVDEETVLSGWIEEVEVAGDGRDSSLSVSGRAITGDLVDCHVIGDGAAKRSSWRKATTLQIARDLCEPFGIEVSSDVADLSRPVPHFRTQPGETVFDALLRLAQDHGVRLSTSPLGELRFVRTGSRRSGGAIRYGVNVHRYSIKDSSAERFSTYIFRGQIPATDETSGKAAASVSWSEDDPVVGRYRPFLIQDDIQGGADARERRARFERNTRAGRALVLSYDVRPLTGSLEAWYAAPGEIWEENTIVSVEDEEHGVTGEWLVRSVDLRLANGSATVASLELVAPGAYDVAAKPKKRKKGIVW